MIIFRRGNGENGAGLEFSSDGMIKSTDVLGLLEMMGQMTEDVEIR
jgi:hypothetical protein